MKDSEVFPVARFLLKASLRGQGLGAKPNAVSTCLTCLGLLVVPVEKYRMQHIYTYLQIQSHGSTATTESAKKC